ncbi:MAG: MarR family winged helix-turn-helix transcriptional regulator [Acholeplasma sp.]|nr:MarR family winged helix-turn-helix transcriptional regulator [Acholeplasma sp.]
MNSNYQLYYELKQKTYSIFENEHKAALAHFFKNEINLINLTILQNIKKNPDILITDLIYITNISYSNLSNRFTWLENNNLLSRAKNPDDYRKTTFELTTEGLVLIDKYTSFLLNATSYIRKKLSLSEQNTFLNFLIKLNNQTLHISSKLSKLTLIKKPNLVMDILNALQISLIQNELSDIDSFNTQISYDQIYMLSELFLNQLFDKKSLPALSQSMYISYQTMVSRIKKYEQLEYIKKGSKNEPYIFDDKIKHLIDNFINSRIISYLKLMKNTTEQEEKIVIRFFKYLKDYSHSIITSKD